MIGGGCITLPVMMYEDVIGLLDFGKGSVIGTVLLVPAVIAFILDTINRDKASSSFGIRPFKRIDNPIAETVRAVRLYGTRHRFAGRVVFAHQHRSKISDCDAADLR